MILPISQEVAMADLLVRNVSDELKESLVARADRAGHSVSDEVKAILQQEVGEVPQAPDLNGMSAWEALRSIMKADSEEEATEYIKIMDEIEVERKRDFGRPVEGFE
jgi:plasmid stability protein